MNRKNENKKEGRIWSYRGLDTTILKCFFEIYKMGMISEANKLNRKNENKN